MSSKSDHFCGSQLHISGPSYIDFSSAVSQFFAWTHTHTQTDTQTPSKQYLLCKRNRCTVINVTAQLNGATKIWVATWKTCDRATFSYSARRYDSAVCCSKMSCDAFLSDALYKADKALEKFAAVRRECACLRDGRQSR